MENTKYYAHAMDECQFQKVWEISKNARKLQKIWLKKNAKNIGKSGGNVDKQKMRWKKMRKKNGKERKNNSKHILSPEGTMQTRFFLHFLTRFVFPFFSCHFFPHLGYGWYGKMAVLKAFLRQLKKINLILNPNFQRKGQKKKMEFPPPPPQGLTNICHKNMSSQ